MSFLTALLGGFGAYGQGRQQKQQFDYQKQQDSQAEADRQRQLGIQQATWQETARQILANRGTDPSTATWDPKTESYVGGTPYAMPKGWQVVPNDPAQAQGHYQRLMNWLAGQNRLGSDIGQTAQAGFQTASTQVAAQQKQMYDAMEKALGWQHEDKMEDKRLANSLYVEQYHQAFQGREDQLTRDQAVMLHNDDERVKQAMHLIPSGDAMYHAMVASPEGAVKGFDTKLASYRTASQQIVGSLTTTNDQASAAWGKLRGGQQMPADRLPNPNMQRFSTVLGSQITEMEQHPEHIQQAVARIAFYNKLYHQDPEALAQYQAMYKNKTPAEQQKAMADLPSKLLSDDQAGKATMLLQNVASAASGRRSAQNIVNTLNKQLQGGGYYGGGSNAGGNPTERGAKLPQRTIWDMLVKNGATPQEATTLAAIAYAESGGDPTNVNRNDPLGNGKTQTAWGLFQIGDGTHNEPRGWNNPDANTRMAIGKLRRQGLGAWGTYNTGAYKRFLPAGVTP